MPARAQLSTRNGRRLVVRLAAAAASVAALGLVGRYLGPLRTGTAQHVPSGSAEHRPDSAQAFSGGTEWVDVYDPGSAYNGYTLILWRRRFPTLIDMNGNVLHRWGGAAALGRARLSSTGRLLAMCPDNAIREYAWDGRVVWEFVGEANDLAHHDTIRLNNGNTLIIYLDGEAGEDYLLEVDPHGRAVWRWVSGDHLSNRLGGHGENPRDKTHINSVQELPHNRWWRGGDPRFRPGNLLVSARALNLVFIIDRGSGAVVWHHDDGLDFQHEALMIEGGHPGAGNILVFNNGYNNRFGYRKSAVLEIDPLRHSVVWEYSSPHFFSSTGGVQQSLPNGNILIVSSSGGRCFEVTRGGRIVWQWVPPYDPMRPVRYEYGYCRRFRELPQPSEREVETGLSSAYVDRELRQYALGNRTRLHELRRRRRRVLNESGGCGELVIPPNGILTLSYGIDPEVLAAFDESEFSAVFRARLELTKSGDAVLSLSDTLRSGDTDTWRERHVRLDRYALQSASLCLGAEGSDAVGGRLVERAAMWGNPFISSPYERRRRFLAAPVPTERERQLARERLRALGYVE